MKKGLSFWDILAWIVLAGIAIWLILKMFGIINTPVILQYAPYFGAIYLAGWQMHKLETVAKEVEGLKKFRNETVSQINDFKLNCMKSHKK